MTEKVKLEQIKFDRANANKGTARGRGVIESSLREFGFADAGTLDKNNTIIGGNKRTEVAGEIGMDEAIIVDIDGTKPVFIRRNDLSLDDPNDDRARRLAYALNRTQQLSLDWDVEQLLADAQAGLDLQGLFEQSELDAMLAELAPTNAGGDTEPQIDKAEELRQKWQTSTGQLWQLGQHRLVCGDCTDKATVERLMGGEKADMMFTDPPYGVDYSGGTGSYSGGVVRSKTREGIANDGDCSLYGVAFDLALVFLNSGPCYVWYADKYTQKVMGYIPPVLELRRVINWYKINQGFGDMGSDYHCVTEPCLYLVKGKSRYTGLNNETNIWELQRPQKNELHPTQKPLELAEKAIGNHDAGIVLDPFLGSGTTIIAAHNLNRRCFGAEISPAYCGVILQRFFDHTGIQPQLIDTGILQGNGQ